jgi:rfaE bifunctional protein kinase chain/domain
VSQPFLELLESFSSRRVAVVGDFLLDQYIIGNSSRVSREAPIVVIDYERAVNHPGGAANAAQNIAALGARALSVGVIGDDREGDALKALLGERGVDTGGLVVDGSSETSSKLRIMAGEMNAQKQQVARVDRSHRLSMDDAGRARLLERLEDALSEADAVLISDYGMGVVPGPLSEAAIARSRDRGTPVVVDSRFDLKRFAGATVATPNEVEATAALGLREGERIEDEEICARLRESSGIAGFIVTRGSKGMLVCDGGGATEAVGIVGSNEATDVTGAGDTVSAVVALSLASGASLIEAARMATFAAAIVVMKRGTAVASPAEIRELIAAHAGPA